uniref:Uncharacterized protein n=1 Tax=Cacopsylla melanoneura TaxID=428564 RepID=A0A8D8YAK1_9HEMI
MEWLTLNDAGWEHDTPFARGDFVFSLCCRSLSLSVADNELFCFSLFLIALGLSESENELFEISCIKLFLVVFALSQGFFVIPSFFLSVREFLYSLVSLSSLE